MQGGICLRFLVSQDILGKTPLEAASYLPFETWNGMRYHSRKQLIRKALAAVLMRTLPGGVELTHPLHKDVLEDVADASAPCKLRGGQLLTTPVQHLAIPHRIGVQQAQQQSSTAVNTKTVVSCCMEVFACKVTSKLKQEPRKVSGEVLSRMRARRKPNGNNARRSMLIRQAVRVSILQSLAFPYNAT